MREFTPRRTLLRPKSRPSQSPDSLSGSTRRGAAVTGRSINRPRIGNLNAIFLTVAGLVSTLLHHDAAPVLGMASLYHRRWQVEEVFDELKTHLLKSRRVLRSKTAQFVRQEFCGWVLAHRARPNCAAATSSSCCEKARACRHRARRRGLTRAWSSGATPRTHRMTGMHRGTSPWNVCPCCLHRGESPILARPSPQA